MYVLDYVDPIASNYDYIILFKTSTMRAFKYFPFYTEHENSIFKPLTEKLDIASKEIYIGKYYIQKGKWIPAINRFKFVVNNYEETEFVMEALHRLVEVHYLIGLENEAKKYANLLGYNYQSSEWYENSYIFFDRKYKKKENKKIKRNKYKEKIKKFLKINE